MTPDREEVLQRFAQLRVWRRGGERAPHKPFLVLLMLGRLLTGDPRLAAFSEVEAPLRELLADFGPPRTPRPEYPFWHLQTDGVWEVVGSAADGRGPAETPTLAATRTLQGGFAADVWKQLRDDPDLVRLLAQQLVAAHVPSSLHDDVLDRVGLATAGVAAPAARRDPRFRVEVLRAYEYRCAVCGFDGRLDATPVALDAAHLRWWAAGGPDDVANGVALCVVHHKLLDLGAIGFTRDLRIMVSRAFYGGDAVARLVHRFAGAPLGRPQAGLPPLAEAHRTWHEREVFRAPPRVDDALAAESSAPYG